MPIVNIFVLAVFTSFGVTCINQRKDGNPMKGHSNLEISFYRSSPQGVVPIEGPEMDVLIPTQAAGTVQSPVDCMSYGAYLMEIKTVILSHSSQLERAFAGQCGHAPGHVNAVDIIVEKHGSDYHPARIRVNGEAGIESFVLNVALTDRGRSRLRHEFALLQELSRTDEWRLIPRVYFMAQSGPLASLGGEKMVMFLGEWLDGYHEFHYSRDPETNGHRVKVWDTDEGYRFLSFWEESELFRQAAFILTFYYDTANFREIFPWHHAAGDFVVNVQGGKLRVRLITVRQYKARAVFDQGFQDNAVHALLLFLINLTMRMRLDREDGVGDTLWARGPVLDGVVQGFIDALKIKTRLGSCDRSLIRKFSLLAAGTSLEEFTQLCRAVVESYDEAAPDSPVVRENSVEHILDLHKKLMRLPANL